MTWYTCAKPLSIFTLLVALVLLTTVDLAEAQAQGAPPYLTHHGRLFGVDNEPVIDVTTLTFRLYDAADDTGAVLWSETLDVSLSNGYYSVVLGHLSTISDTIFDGRTLYLGISVGDETAIEELSPRLEITSVPYAMRAGIAENAVGALTPDSISLGGGSTTLNSDGSVNIGAATIDTDGTISLGAAIINTDGSIVIGNTVIDTDGAISVAGNPVIASDGSVDSSSISGVTLTDLEGAGCTTGQLPRFDEATGWGCVTPSVGTVYNAGQGLTLVGGDTFTVDFGLAQQRITETCTANEKMTTINADGTVICEPDVDTDTTYTAGNGLSLSGTAFAADTSIVQARVTGTCGAGQYVQGINADGSASCGTDTNTDTDTTYTAGNGLSLSGTAFAADTSIVQARVTGTCGAGQYVQGINADGSASCGTDTDTNTTYNAGTGLNLSGTTFSTDYSIFDGVKRDCPVFGQQVFDGASATWSTCPTPWNCNDLPSHAGCSTAPASSDYANCKEIFDDAGFNGTSTADDRQYWIDPDGPSVGSDPIKAFCLMSDGGGGWTQGFNIDTNDGNFVHFQNTTFWTDNTTGHGTVDGHYSGDYKNLEVFRDLPGSSILIVAHDEGAVLAWRSWKIATPQTLDNIMSLNKNTILTFSGLGSSNPGSLDTYEAVVRPNGQLMINREYGWDTSTDWSRFVNNQAPAFSAPNNGDDACAGIGLVMNVSDGTNGSQWDAGYGWDAVGYQKALMGSDEVPGDPWATSNQRGLNYDYAIFIR